MTAAQLLLYALLPVCAAAGVDYPAAAGYVNDLTGTLPDAVQQALELRVRAYERATSNEVAVAIVPSLKGQSVEEFAQGLFRSWKVGQAGLNNGVLFLWVPSERKMRIEVGYGLENSLTEPQCAQILSQATGLFRQGDYSEGVRTVVDSIIQQLGKAAPSSAPPPAESRRDAGNLSGMMLLGGIALFAIALGVMHYHTSRAHYLQQEVPAAIARAAESIRDADSLRVQAAADLEALRAEAPPEVWEDHATTFASSPGHLEALRQELNRIQSERREEYREWNSAHRALRRWNHTLEKQTALFAAIGATLKQFRESRDAAVERISGLPALLSQMNDRLADAGSDARYRQLLQAAQENFDKAGELRGHPPVNWLLARDLLNDSQACLDCVGVLMDPEAGAQQKRSALQACRQTRYWAGSGMQSPASDQMLALMTVWNNQNSFYDASGASVSSSGGSFDGGGGGTFGGGDTGGSGASASY